MRLWLSSSHLDIVFILVIQCVLFTMTEISFWAKGEREELGMGVMRMYFQAILDNKGQMVIKNVVENVWYACHYIIKMTGYVSECGSWT